MKYIRLSISVLLLINIFACKKDSTEDVPTSNNIQTYSSIQDFLNKNETPSQFYSVDATLGGNFTTPQGTMVTIPGNSFVNGSGYVSGNINIEFKDVYSKSDMLLSDKPTVTTDGKILKSAGEFFIRFRSNNEAIQLDHNRVIEIKQPIGTEGYDMNMVQYIGEDSGNDQITWTVLPSDTLQSIPDYYVYSLYHLQSPEDSGTWCNSDNAAYFSAFPQTTLTLQPNDNSDIYSTQVFLVFKNLRSMVHVYINGNIFPYNFAPDGLECTMVAMGVAHGKLFSCFTPITIGTSQNVSFTLSETNTESFRSTLKALD